MEPNTDVDDPCLVVRSPLLAVQLYAVQSIKIETEDTASEILSLADKKEKEREDEEIKEEGNKVNIFL